MSPIILIGLGVVLLGLGVGLGYLLAYVQRNREAAKASDIQNELDAYRQQVSEHFSQTAQHFQTLGQQYQSLYEHMAEGAHSLCDSKQSEALPGFVAAAAPALAAATVEEAAEIPEVVRDYAPVADDEAVQAEPDTETELNEPVPEITASAETLDEPAANDPGEDQVRAEVPVERERTVH